METLVYYLLGAWIVGILYIRFKSNKNDDSRINGYYRDSDHDDDWKA